MREDHGAYAPIRRRRSGRTHRSHDSALPSRCAGRRRRAAAIRAARRPAELRAGTRNGAIAVSPLGRVRVGWRGNNPDCHPTVAYWLLEREFDFADTPAPIAVPDAPGGLQLFTPSVGISDSVVGNDKLGGRAWSQTDGTPVGLLAATDLRPEHAVRGCTPYCRETYWRPSVSMSQEGETAIAWAEAEREDAFTWYNIALRLYDEDGNLSMSMTAICSP
jgi:hypothetical protein